MNFTTTNHNDTYPAIQTSQHAGHYVLVTGASRGIGRATALSFAKAGAAGIAIAARTNLDGVEAEIVSTAQSAGHSAPTVLKLALDVTDEISVANAATQASTKFGRLDILVNNAGYLETWHPVAETNPVDWWRSWEINLKGVYLMTRAFLPLLLKSGHKTIVNITSVGAHMTRPGASAYQTAKFALLRFTEFVATEYGDQGVVVFAMHPGGVPTDLGMNMPEAMHAILVDSPHMAGDSIAWLTQEKRSWLNGRYISANWDLPELMARKEEIVQGDKLKMRMVV